MREFQGAAVRTFAIFCVSVGYVCHGAESARIVIEPSSPVILGEPVSIVITNLSPNERVTLVGERTDSAGVLWRSFGLFEASDGGVVNPALEAPLEGTWSGVDPLGIFWAMKKTDEEPRDLPEFLLSELVIRFKAIVDDEVVSSVLHKSWYIAPGVEVEEIRKPGFVATFFRPAGDEASPGIIVLGGSEGGIPTMRAALLASHGYSALALAYYRVEGLSQRFSELPLENVEHAIEWLEADALVDTTHLAVIGASKGAELALLSGSFFPKIRAVAAFAPSHVVWQGIFTQSSSWSYRGEPLPFVPYGTSPEFARTGLLIHLYNSGLARDDWPDEARIRVEKIQGPVLLVSGRKDAMNDSTGAGEKVMARLKKHEHPSEYRHLISDDAGHHVSGPGYRKYEVTKRSGGISQATAKAQDEGWVALLEFLGKHVRREAN